MRKKWSVLLGIIIVAFMFAGCGTDKAEQGNGTETERGRNWGFGEAGEEEPVVESKYAEEKEYPQLAEFLAFYYKIPKEQWQETRYYYNFMDLNGDGRDEIFAVVISDELEISDGDPILLLLDENNGEFSVIEDFGTVHTPILVRETKTNGWHDIELRIYGRGLEDGYLICHYNPEGGYQTEDNEFLEEIENPVSGVQILSNNLIDDMDNGRYLTIGPQMEE